MSTLSTVSTLSLPDFLTAAGPILDVRSPDEHAQGHIPDAISFPLFSNDERAQVGTCYKHQGHDAAVELGLEFVGPKLASFVQQAKELAPNRIVRLHCWRGGLRSGSMAWLLKTAGFQVTLLDRGYKGFRQWVRAEFATPKPILTLGGMTGTGKTLILHALSQLGEQVLDLERWANHRGSSYGSLGLPPQPTTEQFENLVAMQWSQFGTQKPVWIEAESRMVGTCRVPNELFSQMLAAPVLQVERSRSERIQFLLEEYGTADRHELIAATQRLQKRLGNERMQAAVQLIQEANLAAAIEVVLDYYDRAYLHDLQRRKVTIHSVKADGLSAEASAQMLVQIAKKLAFHYQLTA